MSVDLGTYGKGRSFDEMVEIAAARRRRILELQTALHNASSAAGHPDAAEGCRNVIAIARAALDG
jgi:hypothetical protein